MAKLAATGRASALIAAVMAMVVYVHGVPQISAPDGKEYPPAVIMAAKVIMVWEGLRTVAYLDPVGIWTICYGETLGVRKGMRKTPAECTSMLYARVYRDFYRPMLVCAPPLAEAPDGVQGAMIAGAYNFGVGSITSKKGWCGNSPGDRIRARDWAGACYAQTAYNKARIDGVLTVMPGLDRRRTMGDSTRTGEGELCITAATKNIEIKR